MTNGENKSIRLLPWMRDKIDAKYPGTTLAITDDAAAQSSSYEVPISGTSWFLTLPPMTISTVEIR